MKEKTAEIVNVVEKTRIEEDGSGRGPYKDTWKEVEIQGPEEKISQQMADYLWHEFGISAEQKGLEVIEK
jgi:hypothetical protein